MHMQRIQWVLCAAVVLSGCASNTGVVPMGQGNYMIAKQAATGFPGLGNLKGEAIAEAVQYCQRGGLDLHVNQTQETAPPFIFGNYPRAEVQFTCVAK